jgi:hypothetical protein
MERRGSVCRGQHRLGSAWLGSARQDPVAPSAELELHVKLVEFDEAKQTWDMTIDEKLAMAIEVQRSCGPRLRDSTDCRRIML